ncbi:DNA-binding IclR family transcriptional regulator [Leifsonia sp. EB41]|uniref:IclR family transcriptional regulator n=1 Tax=Leifsonia sp. EB41 TaxID=3156260 RepID=UPI003519D034
MTDSKSKRRAKPVVVPAVENALEMLTFLAGQRGPVAAATISRALALPRSSTYHILSALEAHGYVSHIAEERKYGLGVAAFELSSGFSRQQPLARLGTPLLADLVDHVGESAHLGVLHGRDVLYIVEMRAKNRQALITDVGVRLPSDMTASGRAMLSLLPPNQLRALFPGPEAFSSTKDPVRAPYAALKSRLAQARQDGFSREDQDVTSGLASIALPVVDHLGWPAAAIAVTFPREQILEADYQQLAAKIKPYADELTRRIGGVIPTDS